MQRLPKFASWSISKFLNNITEFEIFHQTSIPYSCYCIKRQSGASLIIHVEKRLIECETKIQNVHCIFKFITNYTFPVLIHFSYTSTFKSNNNVSYFLWCFFFSFYKFREEKRKKFIILSYYSNLMCTFLFNLFISM